MDIRTEVIAWHKEKEWKIYIRTNDESREKTRLDSLMGRISSKNAPSCLKSSIDGNLLVVLAKIDCTVYLWDILCLFSTHIFPWNSNWWQTFLFFFQHFPKILSSQTLSKISQYLRDEMLNWLALLKIWAHTRWDFSFMKYISSVHTYLKRARYPIRLIAIQFVTEHSRSRLITCSLFTYTCLVQ